MGWVMMSERELNRVEVLAQVDDGRLSVDNAANMLDLTRRQVFRLLKRYRQDGAAAIRHRSRGRTPNNQIHKARRDYALTLIKEQYPDFGPTLTAEMLAEHHGFKVSRETLRKWMQEDGIWLSRKQRRRFHRPRLRRECFGELIQIDGSDHRWFEDRGKPNEHMAGNRTDGADKSIFEVDLSAPQFHTAQVPWMENTGRSLRNQADGNPEPIGINRHIR